MTTTLLPATPRDWFAARMALLNPDLIRRVGRPQAPVAKTPVDLVPGNAFIDDGTTRIVTAFPVDASGWVHVHIDSYPHAILLPAEQELVTWRDRTFNYGTVRCDRCGCRHTGTHTRATCNDLIDEQRWSNSE